MVKSDLINDKKAEECRQYQEMISNIFDLSSDAISLTKVFNGEIIDCNHKYLDLIGYSHEEVIGHTSSELKLFNFEEHEVLVNEIRKNQRISDYEIKVKRKDDTFINILFSARFVTVDGIQTILSMGKDITESKTAEDKNEELSKQLQVALDAAKMGWWHYNPITDISTYDDKYKEIFGVLGSERPNEEILKLLHPDDLPGVWAKVEEALDPVNPKKYYAEYRIYRNNEIRWIEAHGIASFEGYGNEKHAVSLVGTVNDITERKRSEKYQQELLEKEQQLTEELRSSNEESQSNAEKLQITNEELRNQEDELLKINKALSESVALLDVSYEAIFSWDYDGGILSWNQGAERLYGYTSREAIGQVSHDLLKTQFPIEFDEFIERLTDDKMWTGEITHTTKDNAKIVVETRQQLITDSSGNKIIIETNRDITERKKSEEILERQAALLDVSYEAIFSWDCKKGIVSWNHGAERLYGYTSCEAIGRISHDLLKTQFPIEFDGFIERLTDDKMWTGEITHTTKNGQKIIVETRQQLILNPSGKEIVIETNRDITERKKSEEIQQDMLESEHQLREELQAVNEELQATGEELRTSNEGLEEQVNLELEAKMELEEITNRLRISNRELEQFAYVASHDLQEPLRMVTSFAQLLERRYKGHLDSDADDYIEFIVENGKRMKYLIDDLLEFSRLNSQDKEFETTYLEMTLDDVLSNLSMSIKDNNAKITHDPLPTLNVNLMYIRQLFQNLISNAIKFHGDEPPEIHISAYKTGNVWTFGVKDNGIGIEPQHQKMIFGIFKRLHTREEYPGTGIGLALCKRIVDMHKGRMWLVSEPGKGSTFYFTIPSYDDLKK